MTRKEEIWHQALISHKNCYDDYVNGAEWADENPSEEHIAAYLSKKGWPLNRNGEVVSYDEALKLCINSVKYDLQKKAEEYSFNIQSELFQKLTFEEQKLWIQEIEWAYKNAINDFIKSSAK